MSIFPFFSPAQVAHGALRLFVLKIPIVAPFLLPPPSAELSLPFFPPHRPLPARSRERRTKTPFPPQYCDAMWAPRSASFLPPPLVLKPPPLPSDYSQCCSPPRITDFSSLWRVKIATRFFPFSFGLQDIFSFPMQADGPLRNGPFLWRLL